jgi:hypothetical protein
MGMRQMTFEIPEEVAERFISEVPESERSAEMTKLLLWRVSRPTKQMEDVELIAACDAVNADPELNELMEDWQAAGDPIEEPWDEPAPR